LPWRTVVGVVGDTRKTFASAQPDVPDVYVPYAQNPRSWQAIVVRTSRPESSMFESIKRAVGSVDAGLAPSGVESVENLAAQRLGQRSGLLVLLGAFATFALVLSALALYASLAYTVLQRRSELAVRRAVGASAAAIMRLVVGEGLVTAALGVVAGTIASLALSRVLANQLFGIGRSDPVTLVSIAIVLAFTALAACAIPGLRAARSDPALALRD
jgi:putative ABC transport system permease protein